MKIKSIIQKTFYDLRLFLNDLTRSKGKSIGMVFFMIMIFFCSFLPSVLAQSSSPNLQSKQWLSISDGLAHNGVTSIFADSRGYLWVGTYDGLNRYDGYDFKVFKNTVEKKIFISNRIRTITEDGQGHLWIGTDEGISIYNPDQQDFKNIYSNQLTHKKLSGPIVRKILFSKKHEVAICATEGFGILVLGKDFSFHNQYLPLNENPDRPVLFFDGIALDETNYLFSTSIGMLLFNLEEKRFTPVLRDKIQFSKSVAKTNTNGLIITRMNGISVISYSKKNGTYSFDWQKNDFDAYQLTSAELDPSGNLWLGSLSHGVVKIDGFESYKTNNLFTKKYFDLKSGRLRVSCFFFSENSGAWVGTFNKGFYQFDLKENPFKSYNIEKNSPYGLSTNRILAVSSLDNDRVFISASRGGLAIFNTITQTFESLPFSLPENLAKRVAKVYVDSKKDIWIWFSEGNSMGRIRKGQQDIQQINLPELNGLSLRYITEDKKGNIWIGAVEGIYKIILDEGGEIKDAVSLNKNLVIENKIVKVRYIYMDEKNDGLVWIGTQTEGLFRLQIGNSETLEDATIRQFLPDEKSQNTLPSNFVSCITRIPDGSLWIGTERGGICKVLEDKDELQFITYSESHGLSNNVVKAIIYDNGFLWVPTNIGLNRFDLSKNRFQIFRKTDGLPFENFEYPSEKLENGFIMVAGADGFYYFNPRELKKKETLPQLVFGDFKLFGETVLPNDTINNRILLQKSLDNTEEIILNYNENVFSFQLKSLHFSNPDNHLLRYKLSPINENWIERSSDQKEITYNALPPGNYILSVQVSNSQNEWTTPRALKIDIKPPFWKTSWAYMFYFLLLIGIIALILFVMLRIQSLNHNLAIEKIEKDNIKELNASKLRFFSNISHEIKTPIALISGPVELLLQRFRGNKDVNENLKLIKRQSNKINQLVEQVHDFQKADANILKMKHTHFSLNEFVDNLIADFHFMANQEEKTLELKSSEQSIFVYADKKKLEKIFNNLLSNAFKYSQAGDTIIFSYKKEENNVIIKVQDTGRGISEIDLPHIFDRFYQSENNLTKVGGAGIGLAFSKKLVDMHFGFIQAESELEKGSIFTVRLPIVKPQLKQADIEREQKILLEEEHSLSKDLLDRKVELSAINLEEDFSGTQIYLAEDNTELRNFIAGVLSKFFKVKTFSNGNKCWDAMKTEWPDLLVSDVMMPEMNGFELCRKIKSDIKTSHIPVLLLTAFSSIEDQIEGLQVGADTYVKKPFDVQHLVMSIIALLKSRKQLRERFQIDYPVSLEKNEHSENDATFLEKLYEIMETNLDNQEVELDSFAKALFLNRTHFYQKVKALTNYTPYELMKEFRLKKAAEMLVQQNLSVSQVYTMTGFKSRTHFSKLFKEKYNISPGKYGKQ